MKFAQYRPLRTALLVLATAALGSLAQAAPAVSCKQALQLAEEALADKNPSNSVYVESVVLTRSSIFNGKVAWTVTWSSVVPASKPGTEEVGVEISMDGAVTHLVKGRGKPSGKIPEHIGHP